MKLFVISDIHGSAAWLQRVLDRYEQEHADQLLILEDLPPLYPGDLFIQGHTHIPVAERRGDFIMLNPGSISLPKNEYPHSYAILDDDQFRVLDFSGHVIKHIRF